MPLEQQSQLGRRGRRVSEGGSRTTPGAQQHLLSEAPSPQGHRAESPHDDIHSLPACLTLEKSLCSKPVLFVYLIPSILNLFVVPLLANVPHQHDAVDDVSVFEVV
jgi:hypothetical protein